MKSVDYSNIKINGLNYVREISSKSGNTVGYILVDNKNKPIKDVYRYISRRKKKHGDELNTLKRICQDLRHFYDYMLINGTDVELLTYEHFYNFVDGYLRKIDPDFRPRDTIDRSMLKKVPLLSIYKNNNRNITVLNENNIGGFTSESINRILNTCKNFLIYLERIQKRNINIENIFTEKIVNFDRGNMLLGHLSTGKKVVYSVTSFLKAAKIPFKSGNEPNPISNSRVFEDIEMQKFFSALREEKNSMYYLFFYLISKTGIRISEARAIKIWKLPKISIDMDFNELESDIKLIEKGKRIWEINIVIRRDNPSDLQIKSVVNRAVYLIDNDGVFENLLRQAIIFRKHRMRKKKKDHEFLFINRGGNRYLNARVEQKFHEIMNKAGLIERAGRRQLVIHSLRHTFASKWIKELKGKNIDVELNHLSKLMGHSNSDVTRKTYLHFFKDDLINVLVGMERTSRLIEKEDE